MRVKSNVRRTEIFHLYKSCSLKTHNSTNQIPDEWKPIRKRKVDILNITSAILTWSSCREKKKKTIKFLELCLLIMKQFDIILRFKEQNIRYAAAAIVIKP